MRFCNLGFYLYYCIYVYTHRHTTQTHTMNTTVGAHRTHVAGKGQVYFSMLLSVRETRT